MLDTTSSAIKDTQVPRFIYQLGKLQQATSFSRIINAVAVFSILKKKNGYTEKEIKDYSKFMNPSYNDTLIDQLSDSTILLAK